jgi:hypothetical protein
MAILDIKMNSDSQKNASIVFPARQLPLDNPIEVSIAQQDDAA